MHITSCTQAVSSGYCRGCCHPRSCRPDQGQGRNWQVVRPEVSALRTVSGQQAAPSTQCASDLRLPASPPDGSGRLDPSDGWRKGALPYPSGTASFLRPRPVHCQGLLPDSPGLPGHCPAPPLTLQRGSRLRSPAPQPSSHSSSSHCS